MSRRSEPSGGRSNTPPRRRRLSPSPEPARGRGGPRIIVRRTIKESNASVQYLTLTRPELAYAVQQACLHMHDPHDEHWNIVKRIPRYLRGTSRHGILLRASTSTALTAYTDADWAGCPDTRRSTSGFCIFLGDALISWSSKRQAVVSRSLLE